MEALHRLDLPKLGRSVIDWIVTRYYRFRFWWRCNTQDFSDWYLRNM